MSQAIATELQHIIEQMEHLVAHPRIQQKTWVAKGKAWLPILRIAKAHLESDHLQLLIEQMEHLVAHPRIQQKTWVAKGKAWLPVLRIAKAHLEALD